MAQAGATAKGGGANPKGGVTKGEEGIVEGRGMAKGKGAWFMGEWVWQMGGGGGSRPRQSVHSCTHECSGFLSSQLHRDDRLPRPSTTSLLR